MSEGSSARSRLLTCSSMSAFTFCRATKAEIGTCGRALRNCSSSHAVKSRAASGPSALRTVSGSSSVCISHTPLYLDHITQHLNTHSLIPRSWPRRSRQGGHANTLILQDGAGVAQTSLYVLARQSGVVAQQVRLTPALRQEIDDKLDREACALNDRFPNQDARINDDAFLPVHTIILLMAGSCSARGS